MGVALSALRQMHGHHLPLFSQASEDGSPQVAETKKGGLGFSKMKGMRVSDVGIRGI